MKKNKQNISENKQTEKEPRLNFSEKTRRRFRFGTNSILLMIAVITAFVLLNLALERLPLTLDLTTEQRYSITDTTKKRLSALEKDIEIIALFDRTKGESDTNRSMVIKILDLYDAYDRVTVRYVNPDTNPSFVATTVGQENAGSYSAGDYIVKCGNKTRRIGSSDMYNYSIDYTTYSVKVSGLKVESNLTTNILYVTSDRIPVIYYETSSQPGYELSAFSQYTASVNTYGCDVKELNLLQSDIPEDAAMILFMNPTADLSNIAYEKVRVYLTEEKGRAMFELGYLSAGTELANFNKLLELFGMQANNDLVTEQDSKYILMQSEGIAFNAAEILTNGPLEGVSLSMLPVMETRSLRFLNASGYFTTYELLRTSSQAVSKSVSDDSTSPAQSHLIAAAGEYTGSLNGGRIVVTGSCWNFQDMYLTYFSNRSGLNFTMACTEWLVEEMQNVDVEGLHIAAKNFDTSTISATDSQVRKIVGFVLVGYSALIILAGGVVWLRRRHL